MFSNCEQHTNHDNSVIIMKTIIIWIVGVPISLPVGLWNCSDSVVLFVLLVKYVWTVPTVCFFHYISLFYIFFSLVYICVYIWIIASSSNFSFHFVASACDFQFVFTPICFVEFIFYLLFVLFFRYTVVVHDFHIRWYSCRLTVPRRVHSCSKNWCPLRSSSPVFIGVRLLNLPVSV